RNGKIAFQGGFGLADIAKKTPVTPDTKFRIGSVSKQFTAAAILRLVEQGKLSLDDPLEKHFPDFSHRPGVTVRHLLTHTSGLHSTGVYHNADPPPDMALGYSLADNKLAPALDWDMTWAGGAGSLYSTVGDLFRWNEALFGGRVLKKPSFKAATTPVELPPGV